MLTTGNQWILVFLSISHASTLTDNLLSRLHIHEPKRNHCDAVQCYFLYICVCIQYGLQLKLQYMWLYICMLPLYMYVVCTSCIYPCTHQVLHQWKVAIGIVTFIEFRHIVEAIRNNPVLYTKSVHFIMLAKHCNAEPHPCIY